MADNEVNNKIQPVQSQDISSTEINKDQSKPTIQSSLEPKEATVKSVNNNNKQRTVSSSSSSSSSSEDEASNIPYEILNNDEEDDLSESTNSKPS